MKTRSSSRVRTPRPSRRRLVALLLAAAVTAAFGEDPLPREALSGAALESRARAPGPSLPTQGAGASDLLNHSADASDSAESDRRAGSSSSAAGGFVSAAVAPTTSASVLRSIHHGRMARAGRLSSRTRAPPARS